MDIEKLINYNKGITPKEAYNLGYDCGINGPNDDNCYFGIFSSPENTKAWEEGKSYAAANDL